MGGREEGLDGGQVLDGAVFRQFKTLVNDQSCIGSDGGDDVGEPEIEVGGEDSRKRKRPCDIFADGHERPADKKYVVVLGDDPKPKQKKRDSNVMNDKKQRTFYNHYENGSGWWDEEREGVDNEEVGCNDVWEGMGSTTLGGLEWH
ncbi:hypothetical protein QJS10_CPA06g00026 [Acorus calamus]|uniref:Uncharacterized protein n=1 Tax=Acorus calamus TaxID=4465 RepID=A0AAV9EPI7_ACOCL|nr:hypothetical protein QJS10_CPA06g00026 [Acorus calamus]